MKNKIDVKLSSDEALVLFDVLTKLDFCGGLPATDSTEEEVFNNIIEQLELALDNPFDDDYECNVELAKGRLYKILHEKE